MSNSPCSNYEDVGSALGNECVIILLTYLMDGVMQHFSGLNALDTSLLLLSTFEVAQ
jgi:hypothetical protein